MFFRMVLLTERFCRSDYSHSICWHSLYSIGYTLSFSSNGQIQTKHQYTASVWWFIVAESRVFHRIYLTLLVIVTREYAAIIQRILLLNNELYMVSILKYFVEWWVGAHYKKEIQIDFQTIPNMTDSVKQEAEVHVVIQLM
jgi:hypothetical protein